MKILLLADLHYNYHNTRSQREKFKNKLQKFLKSLQFDCIAIAGDIMESSFMNSYENPYQEIHWLFENDYPIICCFGNHEFAYQTITYPIKYYSGFQDKRYNIYYLDIEGHFSLNNVNFIGNVFWYDFSLNNNKLLEKDHIVSNWLDATIQNFIPSKEHEKCKQQILDNINSDMQNVLITHTVPHERLNWFSINESNSLYNSYSGCKDFLKELEGKNIIWSVCGHTHKRMTDIIHGINCINIGNDYYWKQENFNYFLIEL